jgi:hypothetical protein
MLNRVKGREEMPHFHRFLQLFQSCAFLGSCAFNSSEMIWVFGGERPEEHNRAKGFLGKIFCITDAVLKPEI